MKSLRGRRTMQHRIARSILAFGVVVASGLIASPSGNANNRIPHLDALPIFEDSGAWIDLRGTGLTYASKGRQWFATPGLYPDAYNFSSRIQNDSRCTPGVGLWPYSSRTTRRASVFLRSSAGKSKPYGALGPYTVRTVAFGSIPVEVLVSLYQLSDSQGKPVGLSYSGADDKLCAAGSPLIDGEINSVSHIHDQLITGSINIGVDALKVDGTLVKISPNCSTVRPADITLSSPPYYLANRRPLSDIAFTENTAGATPLPSHLTPIAENILTSGHYSPVAGGLLTGQVTAPKFKNCTTSTGDDLSHLLTAAISGAPNHVSLRSEGLSGSLTTGNDTTVPLPALPIPDAAP
jgi:hypothetical protein